MRVRYDCFLIWGNGLAHIAAIASMIRNHGNFNIIRFKKVQIADMAQFVKDIYACDSAPWEHLIAKSRYLMNSALMAVFILAINRKPDEHQKGQNSGFRHIECRKMTALKLAIRNAFNPHYPTNRRRAPLNAGVSHEHCIHGSDYESQAEYILRLLGLQDIAYHKRNDDCEYFFPYHITAPRDYTLGAKQLDDLRVNILDKGLVKIEDAPHYQYVCGDTEPYTDYFYKHFGTKLCEDHFPGAFDKLIKGFELNHVRWDGRKSHIIIRGNTILDGVHRAAIAQQRNIEGLQCIQIG